jgi:hypothetical protein
MQGISHTYQPPERYGLDRWNHNNGSRARLIRLGARHHAAIEAIARGELSAIRGHIESMGGITQPSTWTRSAQKLCRRIVENKESAPYKIERIAGVPFLSIPCLSWQFKNRRQVAAFTWCAVWSFRCD